MRVITAVIGERLYLGKFGDNNATKVKFSVSAILTAFGSGGTFTVFNRRSCDSVGYPITGLQVVSGYLEWLVGSADLWTGTGYCQLRYVLDGVIVHTEVYETFCGGSIIGGTAVPNPFVSWVSELDTIKNRAVAASLHYPYIDAVTGKWFVWDVQTGAFVNTGRDATGPKGDSGDVQFATLSVNPMTGMLSVQYTRDGNYTFDIQNGKLRFKL